MILAIGSDCRTPQTRNEGTITLFLTAQCVLAGKAHQAVRAWVKLTDVLVACVRMLVFRTPARTQ
jgi:hypothetical protein